MPSPITDKETTFSQLITQASSIAESHCNRPFLTGSTIDAPTDIQGDAYSEYAVFADIDAVPYDLKTACCLLVLHLKFESEHFAIAGTTDNNKSKNYDLTNFNRALTILNRYKYYESLNEAEMRIKGTDAGDL